MNENPNIPAGKQLKDAPDPEHDGALIFGAPVWAFSLSSVMKDYLQPFPSVNGKKAGCFVTQQLSHAWLGETGQSAG